MVCVYALSTVKKDKIEEHTKLAEQMVAETRKEQGNLNYEFGKVAGSDNQFACVERWESREALELHFETEHFKKFVPMMKELREGESPVSIVEVIF